MTDFEKDDHKKIINLVLEFFSYDLIKTCDWLDCANPLLGGISPLQMLRNGRSNKLLDMVKSLVDEN